MKQSLSTKKVSAKSSPSKTPKKTGVKSPSKAARRRSNKAEGEGSPAVFASPEKLSSKRGSLSRNHNLQASTGKEKTPVKPRLNFGSPAGITSSIKVALDQLASKQKPADKPELIKVNLFAPVPAEQITTEEAKPQAPAVEEKKEDPKTIFLPPTLSQSEVVPTTKLADRFLTYQPPTAQGKDFQSNTMLKSSSEKLRNTLDAKPNNGDTLFKLSEGNREQSDQVVFITDEVFKETEELRASNPGQERPSTLQPKNEMGFESPSTSRIIKADDLKAHPVEKKAHRTAKNEEPSPYTPTLQEDDLGNGGVNSSLVGVDPLPPNRSQAYQTALQTLQTGANASAVVGEKLSAIGLSQSEHDSLKIYENLLISARNQQNQQRIAEGERTFTFEEANSNEESQGFEQKLKAALTKKTEPPQTGEPLSSEDILSLLQLWHETHVKSQSSLLETIEQQKSTIDRQNQELQKMRRQLDEVTNKMVTQEETLDFLAKIHIQKQLNQPEDSSGKPINANPATQSEPSEEKFYYSQDVLANYANGIELNASAQTDPDYKVKLQILQNQLRRQSEPRGDWMGRIEFDQTIQLRQGEIEEEKSEQIISQAPQSEGLFRSRSIQTFTPEEGNQSGEVHVVRENLECLPSSLDSQVDNENIQPSEQSYAENRQQINSLPKLLEVLKIVQKPPQQSNLFLSDRPESLSRASRLSKDIPFRQQVETPSIMAKSTRNATTPHNNFKTHEMGAYLFTASGNHGRSTDPFFPDLARRFQVVFQVVVINSPRLNPNSRLPLEDQRQGVLNIMRKEDLDRLKPRIPTLKLDEDSHQMVSSSTWTLIPRQWWAAWCEAVGFPHKSYYFDQMEDQFSESMAHIVDQILSKHLKDSSAFKKQIQSQQHHPTAAMTHPEEQSDVSSMCIEVSATPSQSKSLRMKTENINKIKNFGAVMKPKLMDSFIESVPQSRPHLSSASNPFTEKRSSMKPLTSLPPVALEEFEKGVVKSLKANQNEQGGHIQRSWLMQKEELTAAFLPVYLPVYHFLREANPTCFGKESLPALRKELRLINI